MSDLPSRLWLGSNLKMYKTNRQLQAYSRQLQRLTADLSRSSMTLFILAPYTGLADLAREVSSDQLWIGAQNIHWEDQGQYTGEISPPMLEDIGVSLVMVGHAERREKFGETDEIVNRKMRASLAHGFQALICVGETLADKEYGISTERLRQQLKIGLHGVPVEQLDQVWVAYEPVWAIGEHGIPSDPEYARQIHRVLHETLAELYPQAGSRVPVLYGGSVSLDNCAELIAQPGIDGLFIGREAWDADNFNHILRKTLSVWQAKAVSVKG